MNIKFMKKQVSSKKEQTEFTKQKEFLYKLVDEFLLGDSKRSISKLNQDRHFFVQELEKYIAANFVEKGKGDLKSLNKMWGTL